MVARIGIVLKHVELKVAKVAFKGRAGEGVVGQNHQAQWPSTLSGIVTLVRALL